MKYSENSEDITIATYNFSAKTDKNHRYIVLVFIKIVEKA